ncbi:aldehyde dehydrogenase family protein [Streptosporangium sp. CA-115845]|uniref:aldehyde dehydrogenase family protein n=1 Tax=Streptosporangium sp. CA-115845 TaxID=3240071 RepID=UPI003D9364D1
MPAEVLNLVAGVPTEGEPFDVMNPAAYDEVVGIGHAAGVKDVDAAVNAASAVGAEWARTPLEERVAAVLKGISLATSTGDPDELPTLLTREQGKRLQESRIEISHATEIVKQFASLAEGALAEEVLRDELGTRVRRHRPVGPVAAITPWNWPLVLSLVKIAPALMTGNPVILKPPPNTPLTVTRVMSALARELPPGVLSVLNGGANIGAELAGHPLIRKVAFTGSTPNGRKVYASAATTVKNLTLELGGNDPAILLDDAELDERSLSLLLGAAFITTGQVCWAIKRLYVPRSRYAEVVSALTSALSDFVVGNGLDPMVRLGPLNNRNQLQIVRRLADGARSGGANVHMLGSYAPGLDPERGYYHLPTLVTDVDHTAAIVSEEQFGPILPIVPYDNEEQVVAMANDTEYGLSASVWSADPDRAFGVARQLETGTVFVNAHGGPALDFTTGAGGVKQSGIGRELGVVGLLQYTEAQSLTNRVRL